MNILLLSGSPSASSRATYLLHHVGEKLALLGHRYTKLHVRDLPAQALLHADASNADLQGANALVAQAQAIVISTPIYKAAYSGILKAYLDFLPEDGLAGKLVLPLATGGSQSHMLALDYALRPVLSALSAKHILPSIYATDAQINWSPDQGLLLDARLAQRINNGVEHLSASLLPLQRAAVPAMEFDSVPFPQVGCRV